MNDQQLQKIADAAAAYVAPKLIVTAEYDSEGIPVNGLWAPTRKFSTCQQCGSVSTSALIQTSEAAMTQQDPAQYIKAECKGSLDALASALNHGGPVTTYRCHLPDGVEAKALGVKGGLAIRAVAAFDTLTGNLLLRFDCLYARK